MRHRFLVARRLVSACAIAAVPAYAVLLGAQVPGRNVNMVSGVTWPGGDPFLQRQNEPSIASSTRNPLHLLAGANDYRSVDLPGLPHSQETGDAWLGLFKSADGGQRWETTLLPGYPQDTSPEGMASPIKGYAAAADPVVRAGTNGLFYYAGMAFDRTPDPAYPGKSAIFVARYVDNNNVETENPIRYAGTSLVAANTGATRQLLDKPWLAVDIPRRGGAMCRITTPSPNGPITQRIPAGMVYVAYAVKSADIGRVDLYFSRSADCGDTFSTPIRISRSEDFVNQGVNLAISPATGDVYLAWRRLDLPGDTDAIVVARSSDQGRKFNPPGVARRFPRGKKKGLDPWKFSQHGRPASAPPVDAAEIASFDQGTSAMDLAFRTNSYPSMAIDGEGRIYLAWAERGFASEPSRADAAEGDARILVSTSTNGQSWSAPVVAADRNQMGHQIMPSLAFAGGKLMLVFYDLQEDRSGVFQTKFIDDRTAFAQTAPDRRHTIDLRAAMAAPGAVPAFAPSVRVSDYLQGFSPGVPVMRDEAGKPVPQALQVNPPNLPMFKLGTAPFMGDYIDVAAAPAFVATPGGSWAYNTEAGTAPPAFHVAWTDNRDVRAPLDGNWVAYTPPNYAGPRPDPLSPYEMCVPGRAGMRNQNIYTARVTGGLFVGSPQNAKPLTTTMQRTFVVFAQNGDATNLKTFRMTILNQPPGGRASFEQQPGLPYTTASPPPLTVLDLAITPRTTASRTVYVTSTDPHASIAIDVSEIAEVGAPGELAGGLDGTILLNPDVTNPEVDNPEVDNPEVANIELHNPEVDNPEVDNPEVDNPEVDNPEVDNPEVDNPEVDNIVIANPEVDNPEVDNPEVDNPEVDNPEVDNPEVDNTAVRDGGIITDVTWTLTNTGTTTTAYNTNIFLKSASLEGLDFQLLVYRRYRTPAILANSCDVRTMTQNVLVANIPSPDLLSPGDPLSDQNDPGSDHGTIWLAPGEEAFITLRVFDYDASDNVTAGGGSIDFRLIEKELTLIVQPQPIDPIPFSGGAVEPPAVSLPVAPTTVVTTVADAGPGSLRDALAIANARPGADVVTFNIAGAGPHTISPLSALPVLTEPVLIDGTTQPGYAGTPLIEIEGSAAGGAIGLHLQGGNSVVHGLAINRFATGIEMAVAGGNLVRASRIGTDPAGSIARPNTTGINVAVTSPGNVIGGSEGNIVSGNTANGLTLASGGNRVLGNYIGTNVTGTVALANGGYGIDSAGDANVIGEVGAGNVLSGNSFGAVIRATGTVVRANRIGTNAAGTAAIANGSIGLALWDAENAVVGGRLPGEGNLISGNGFGLGLAFSTGASVPAVVEGNLIGTAANGIDPLGNASANIYATGAARARVGDTAAGAGNVIGFSLFGVWVEAGASIALRGNSIFSVGFQAIDLGLDGPTANDALDADAGPNLFQNYPVVTGVTATTVGGELFSAASQNYTIDFYASPIPGNARMWIASVVVTTDLAGHAFIPAQAVALVSGQFVTAIATDANGNSSELSASVVVP